MKLNQKINKYLDFSLSQATANKLLDVTLNKGQGKVTKKSVIDPDLYYIVDLTHSVPKLVENASYGSREEANRFAMNNSVKKGSALLQEYSELFTVG